MVKVARNTTRDEWEIREDLNTMKRAQEIRNDPERLRDVQNYIQDSRQKENRILGMEPPPTPVGRRNPATIMKLNTPN